MKVKLYYITRILSVFLSVHLCDPLCDTQNLCVCVRVTTLLLSPRQHKLKTGVIRSSITRGVSFGKKNFTKKMTSGGITDKKLRHQCFVNGENLELFVLSLETRSI